MPVEKINWDKHDVVECDDRGRATLGSEFAGERVFVYVSELPDRDDLADAEEVPEDVETALNNLWRWATDRDIETMFHLLDPYEGTVTAKDGEVYETPYGVDRDE